MEERLTRYVAYSFLAHLALLLGFAFSNLFQSHGKVYYAVDFVGSPAGGGAASQQDAAATVQKAAQQEPVKAKEEPAKTVVNPKEDLLVKSKKKPSKKRREIISSEPIPMPIPGPKALDRSRGAAKEEGSDSVIPGAGSALGAGSGIGIGFGEGGSSGAGTGNFPYTWYVHSVRKKLDSNWNVGTGFPKRVFARVAFTIARDGSLSAVQVEESSQNEVFDRAAQRAVEYSNPLPPLPTAYPESELRVHVTFTAKQ